MAWQQRVGLELNAHRRNLDKVFHGHANQFGANKQLYELYQNIVTESQKSASATGSRKSGTSFNSISKHLYSFGGHHNKNLAPNPVLNTGMPQEVRRPSTRADKLDTMSHASSAYVGKHARRPQRHQSAYSKSIKLSSGSKTFYPDAYFKRVGYEKSQASSHARVDALGQRVRDRFNEELQDDFMSTKGGNGLHSRTLKQLKASKTGNGVLSQTGLSRASADCFSEKRFSVVKQSVKGDRVGTMSTLEAQKDALLEKESVITRDRLKQFNEIQGTVAGTVEDEIKAIEDKQEALAEEGADKAAGEEAEAAAEAEAVKEEDKDEVKSLVAKSVVSKAAKSVHSGTSKTYISRLEQQLEAEKQARLKLEQEVEEMKKINAEISSKLGLTNSSIAASAAKEKSTNKRV